MKKFFRHFSWVLTLPFAVVVVIFAVANRGAVTVDFWPFPLVLQVWLSILILVCVLTGILIGALLMWLSAGKLRRRAREARNRIAQLERDVQIAQQAKAHAEAKAAVPAAGRPEAPLLGQSGGSGQSAA